MKPGFGLLLLAFWCSLAPCLRADPPELQAELHCAPAAGPGRILCELRTSARSGRLVWSDALVVRAPAFARPLRSRFLTQLGTAGAPEGGFAKLALVASEPGQGKLELLARAVVCRDGTNGEWCAPEVLNITTLVEVAQ